MRAISLALLIVLSPVLVACDALGIEPASAASARKEMESKAIGAGCRHAGRAIEDCYALNKKADKGAVFAGWREMNDYMRENKIEAVAPAVPAPADPAAKVHASEAHEDEEAHPTAHGSGGKAEKPKAGKHS